MNTTKNINGFSIVAISFLITGQLVGAGILGIPVIAGITGFYPAVLIILVVCISMLFTSLIFGMEASSEANDLFSFPSLYEKYLGKGVKWVAIILNMILLYGLLIAYTAGGASIIVSLFNIPLPTSTVVLLFFCCITSFALLGVSIIKKFNVLLIMLMWISFIALIVFGSRHIDVSNYKYIDWIFLPATIPIVITSFNFSNLIPVVCKNLNWKMSYVWKAILLGMIIAFTMNIVWIAVGLGIVPLSGHNGLAEAFVNNTPATVPIANIIGTPVYLIFALVFSIISITTSYIANALGIISFNTDLLFNIFKKNKRYLVLLVSFIPPLVITLLYPNIFIKALNITGGICTATLFGIFPSVIAIIKYRNKLIKCCGVCTTVVFCFSLLYISGDLTGIIKRPSPPIKTKIVRNKVRKARGKIITPNAGSKIKESYMEKLQ